MDIVVPLILICFLCNVGMCAFLKVFEFESIVGGPGQLRSPWRSEASGMSALHVFKGDTININLCIKEPTTVSLRNLRYSNDGPVDVVSISLDGKPLATFESVGNKGGNGDFWNVYGSTGAIGSYQKLSSGKHLLSLTIYGGDCFGLELDFLSLSLDNDIANTSLWCGSEFIPVPTLIPCHFPVTEAASVIKTDTAELQAETKPTAKLHLEASTNTNASTVMPTLSPPAMQNTINTKDSNVTLHYDYVSTTQTSVSKEVTTVSSSTTTKAYADINITTESTTPDMPLDNVSSSTVEVSVATTSAAVPSDTSTETSVTTAIDDTIIFPDRGKRRNNDQVLSVSRGLTLTIYDSDHSTRDSAHFLRNMYPNDPLRFLILPDIIQDQHLRESTVNLPTHNNINDGSLGSTISNQNDIISSTPETHSRSLVEQLSYDTRCLDESNINIKFNPLTLNNTVIVARELQRVRRKVIPAAKTTNLSCKESNATRIKLDTDVINKFKIWKIQGAKALVNSRSFNVSVNGLQLKGSFAKLDIVKRPNIEIISIYASGNTFISHSTGRGRRRKHKFRTKQDIKPMDEISGISFGPINAPLASIDIDINSSVATMRFINGDFVAFHFSHSRTRTRITILNTSFTSLTFFSTYITEDLTAVNDLIIDGKQTRNIMSKSIEGMQGGSFKFAKTTVNPVLKANDEIEIILPYLQG